MMIRVLLSTLRAQSREQSWIFLIMFCLLSMIVLFGCEKKPEESNFVKIEKDMIVIGLRGGIFGFHPWIENYETSTMSVNFNVFNSLVEFDNNYKVLPALAVSWGNPDKTTWRFNLRKDVVFHNGAPFTAHDVKYTVDYILADNDNALKDLLTSIDSVVVVDNNTVDIHTKEPTPILLNKMCDIFILSKDYANKKEQKPNGTGAYKLVEYVKGDYIKLERFEFYWKKKVPIKTVLLKVISNDDERINAILTKKIDFAELIPPHRKDVFKNVEGIETIVFPSTRVIYLSFDFREEESSGFAGQKNPTADRRVRQAMYHAIDIKKIIAQVMNDLAEPASQFVSPNIFGYNPAIKRLPYDIAKAKQLLSEAGYADGFTIELDCPNNRYINDEAICHEIARQLAQVNIKVEVKARPKSEHFPKVLGRNTSFYLMGWATDTADGGEIFDYILRTVNEAEGLGSYNGGYYSNSDIDMLGKKSALTVDSKKRLEYMQKGFQIAMDDIVWIPLHLQKLIYGVSSEIEWLPRADVKIKLEDFRYKQ